MKLKQLAKHLDRRAILFIQTGQVDKSIAAMEVAAFIRRQTKEFQKIKFLLADK